LTDQAPIVAFCPDGLSASLPGGEDAPKARLTWAEIEAARARVQAAVAPDRGCPDWDAWAMALLTSDWPLERRVTYLLAGMREAYRLGIEEGKEGKA
jgi:hypothetical protein